jgi:hypothetical protein
MRKKPLPQFVPPMQASSVKEPFDSTDWIFETKLDGYWAVAVIGSGGNVRIWSRKCSCLHLCCAQETSSSPSRTPGKQGQ